MGRILVFIYFALAQPQLKLSLQVKFLISVHLFRKIIKTPQVVSELLSCFARLVTFYGCRLVFAKLIILLK